MAEPMTDGPDGYELDPWPFLTDEDHTWLDGLIDYADEIATAAEVDLLDVMDDLVATALTEDGHGWPLRAPQQAKAWRIHDDGAAEWAMAHVARADDELAQLKAQAAEWTIEAEDRLARIRQWFDHRAARHLATRLFMEAHLRRYALERRAEDPKHAKTLVLPSGAVRTVEHQPKAAVADEDAVVTWVCHQWADEPEVADVVAPPQPRKLYVQRLRDHTEVVEVIDHAQLLLADGELIEWLHDRPVGAGHTSVVQDPLATRGRVGQRCPKPGDGWPTPDEATALVARVEVLASHLEVHGPDGLPVPGTHVEPGNITTTVVPS